MVCDCCGRKKKLFESFAAVKYKQVQMNFCADCNDMAYKVRDDANANNRNDYEKHLIEWKEKAKKPSENFLAWQHDFLAPLEKSEKKKKNQNKQKSASLLESNPIVRRFSYMKFNLNRLP